MNVSTSSLFIFFHLKVLYLISDYLSSSIAKLPCYPRPLQTLWEEQMGMKSEAECHPCINNSIMAEECPLAFSCRYLK